MPSRGLLVLVVVTVVAVVACWFALDKRYSQAALGKREGGLVFPAFQRQVNAITEIEVARAGGQFVLLRNDGGWVNMGMGGYPARPTHVEQVIVAMAGLKYLEPKTERSTLHHKLGVEDVTARAKSTRLTVKGAAGVVLADIIVGGPKHNVAERERPGVYVRRPDDKRAWLAEGTLDVGYDAADWSDRTLINMDPRSLTALTVKHADGDVVALHRIRPEDPKLTVKNLPSGAEVEHQYQIDYMAELLRELRFDDVKRVSATDLPLTPVFEAIVQSSDYLIVTLRASEPEQDGSVWVRIEAQVTSDAQASDRIEAQASRMKSKFDGWRFKFPRTMTDRLKIGLADIIKTDTGIQ